MTLDTIRYIVMCVLIGFLAFIMAEMSSYIWHRYFAHKSVLGKYISTDTFIANHQLHHRAGLDQNHDASEDFVWIVYTIVLIVLSIGVIYRLGFLWWMDRGILITLLTVMVIVFTINWYIHKVIHSSGHWLLEYSYIKDMQTVHFIHHKHPRHNYAILNFSDILFGTSSIGLSKYQD